jgi:hypothetical protein
VDDSFLTYGGRRWLRFGAVSAGLLVLSYLYYRRQMLPHGGTPMGLAYGVLGTVVILLLMVLGVRKRRYGSGLGTVQGWTSAHVYLGLLTMLLIPMHAGFKFRLDIHTTAFVLMTIVVLSGVVGVLLYRTVPSRLTQLEQTIQADKVDKELSRLVLEMRALVKDKSDQFARVCQAEINRLTGRRHRGWGLLWGQGRGDRLAAKGRELAEAVTRIPQAEHKEFQILSRLIMQTVQLEETLRAQMRLRNALQAWLYVHVPVSIALLAAVLIHVIAVFYY